MIQHIGIDIGSSQIKAVLIMEQNNSFKIIKAYSLPTPEDAIIGGTILNYAGITERLTELLASGTFPKLPLSFTIKGSSTIAKNVKVPFVKANTFNQDMRFLIPQYINADYDEYSIDYKVLSLDKTIALAEVIIAAIKADTMSDYISVVESAEQKIAAINIESLALCDLYEWLKLPKSQCTMILDIGHGNTNIIFLKNGVYVYSELSAIGGEHCNELIKKQTKVPIESIEQAKINPDAFAESDDIKKTITQNYIQDLTKDIDTAILKYKLIGGDSPSYIALSGGGAAMPSLQEELSTKYNAAVKIMDPSTILDVSNPIAVQILEFKPAALNMAIAMALR